MSERRLIVMRHAKSSWESGAATDHERPLSTRGRRDAPRIAARLEDLGWVPDRVVSSDSERTRETWSYMETELPADIPVTFTYTLYHGGVDAFRRAVARVPADIGTVLVLGHNPGWESVVAWLSGEDVRMTTANAALLAGEGPTWTDALAEPPGWELVDVLRPKEL